MNADKILFRTHTKIFFWAGLLLLATGFVVAVADISRTGIQIFPTTEQIEHGHQIDLVVGWSFALGLTAEIVGLVCLAFDSLPPKPTNTMRERL